jgi:hypothetical protein
MNRCEKEPMKSSPQVPSLDGEKYSSVDDSLENPFQQKKKSFFGDRCVE